MTNWAARLFAREIDRALAPTGMSSAHMPVLFALGDGKALTQKELAKVAAVEQPTMAATLSRMERDGLITRQPDPIDKRSALISLTPMALEKAETVRQAIVSINQAALQHLTHDEGQQLLILLRKVIGGLEDFKNPM